ncbi:MAG: hypothetical protein R3F55_05630 [Alphaproteobacteria bacterium]
MPSSRNGEGDPMYSILVEPLVRARLTPIVPTMAAVCMISGCALWDGLFSSAPSSQDTLAVSVQRALEYLPDGETLDWTDPETGMPARVTVGTTARDADGSYCRDLTTQTDLAATGVTERYCRDAETERWRPREAGNS